MLHHFDRKRPEFLSKILPRVKGKLIRSVKFIRVIIVVALISLVGVETVEFQFSKPNAFHIGEILVYFALLSGLGLLVEVLAHPYPSRNPNNEWMQRSAMFLQKIETLVTKSAKFFRLAIASALIILVGVETAEFEFRISDAFHIGEIIIYFVLLGILGLLVEVVLHSQKQQQHSMNVLKYKHKFSLEILPYQNWEALTELLARQVSEIVDAKAAVLYLQRPYDDGLELISEWVGNGFGDDQLKKLDCTVCIDGQDASMRQPHYCEFSVNAEMDQKERSYCYPILYHDNLYALFRFFLKLKKNVSEEQLEYLNSISDEIIISLIAGQDRKRISELELAETALAERHSMSNYLHDHLGQNLGYLRMKLEQFVNHPDVVSNDEEFRAELKRMKEVVDESYRFVRNKLEEAIPDSTPLLTNFLQEHAKKVAQRSNINISFISQGISRAVPMELQRAVFFVFQEALSNVEKHSRASHVDVFLEWGADQLVITVIDNGSGFDIEKVSTRKHFGLEIMRERMTGIAGSVQIVSSESIGTTLKIFAPLPNSKKQERITQHEAK